jgi:hypothetical protein
MTNIKTFYYGETLQFTIAAKNRDGGVIDNPASQTLTFWIGLTPDGDPVLTFNSAPEVSLADAGSGVWLVSVSFADYSATLKEGRIYYYNLTTTFGTDDPILQLEGELILQKAINWV